MSLSVSHLYEFGEFRLDTKEKILMRGGEPLALTPKGFDLLTVFVQNNGRLLEKNELMEKLWADSFVEESNLTFNIRQLRKVLGDDAHRPTYIQTVRQHGYRFIAEVKEVVEEPLPTVRGEEEPPAALAEEKLPVEKIEKPLQIEVRKAEKPLPQAVFKFYLPVGAAIILLAASLAVGLIVNKNRANAAANAPILAADFKSEKLTNSGWVNQAVISPDGKRMAYSNEVGGKHVGKQGIWLRQFDTAENIQIIPASDDFYYGLSFSHDGETLYFARGKRNEQPPITIYRISVFGGIPKEIVGEAMGAFSISSDNRQISFVRCPYQSEEYCSLYVADADGGNERRLLSTARPNVLNDNQFSPDGKSIAYAVGQSRSGAQEFKLMEIDVSSGVQREITAHKFFSIKYLSWLPDKSGLLVTAIEQPYRSTKIYQINAQTGEVQTLTKDSSSYNRISLNKAHQKMVATQVVPNFKLWIVPTDNIDSAKQVVSAQDSFIFTPSGKIVYSSDLDGNSNIWTMNADGTEQRQLTNNQGSNRQPLISTDEKYIFFASNRSGSNQIWRMNADGSNQTQISQGEGMTPVFISPDGKSVYYQTLVSSGLGKIPLDTAGNFAASNISNERVSSAAFNTAGDTAAYFSRKHSEYYKIVLMSVSDGKILQNFPLANEKVHPLKVKWANDGKSLFYLTKDESKNILWRLSLKDGKSEEFTDLSEHEVWDFAFSPDDKTFAFICGHYKHDAVLIEGLK